MQWPFKRWGADIVFSGHDHIYERLYIGGLTYIVAGTGSTPGSILDPVDGSLVRSNADSGAVMLEANDQRLTVQYQLRSGKTIDTYTISAM